MERATQFKRKLDISYSEGKQAFVGKVKSGLAACRKGKVTVFEQRKGKDPKVAAAKASAKGRFKTKEINPGPGKYYGKIAKRATSQGTCLAAKSKATKVR